MKLLCTESDTDICSNIIKRLAEAGIEAEAREREPSLFDDGQQSAPRVLHEVWILNSEDIEKANAILYPETD